MTIPIEQPTSDRVRGYVSARPGAIVNGANRGQTAARGVIMPIGLAERWESAYRRYGRAFNLAAHAAPGDQQAAHALAMTSAQVAAVWREMARSEGIAWWASAALRAASDAFDAQAQNWRARAQINGGSAPMASRPTVIRRPADHG